MENRDNYEWTENVPLEYMKAPPAVPGLLFQAIEAIYQLRKK